MRIALISPYDWSVRGGVNSHVTQLADHFRSWDHDVTVFAPASEPDALEDEPNVHVFGKPMSFHAGGSVARISLSWMSPDARKLLATSDFDVMHAHEPLMPLTPYHLFRYSTAAKIGTFHAASDRGNHFYTVTKFLSKRNFRKLEGKIAVSQAAVNYISRYYPGYYNIIPNGIEYEHFRQDCDPMPEFMDGRNNILFVGRPEKRKGLRYLLRAYLRIREAEPNSRLIVVGAGDFTRYRRIMSAFPDVIFRENVPYDDLPRYHRSAHVYCGPNTGNESQGIVLLEAMAAGVPVVASNIEGFAGVITHEVDGLLTKPRDDEDIARTILRVLRNPGWAGEMAKRGQAEAARYAWGRVAHQVMSYYERIIYERRQVAEASPAPAPAKRRVRA